MAVKRKNRKQREREALRKFAEVAEEFFRSSNSDWSDEKIQKKVAASIRDKKERFKTDGEIHKRITILRDSLLKTKLADKNLPIIGAEYMNYLISENKKFLGLTAPEPNTAADGAKEDASRAKAIASMAPEDVAKYVPKAWEHAPSAEDAKKPEVKIESGELEKRHLEYCMDITKKYGKKKYQKEARKKVLNSILDAAIPRMETEVKLDFKLDKEMEFVRREFEEKGLHGKKLDQKVAKRRLDRFQTIMRLGHDPEEMDAKQLLQAERIWKDLSSIARGNSDDKMRHIQGQYKEFFQGFPVVARYMAEGFFDPKTFKRLLVRLRYSAEQSNAQEGPKDKDTTMDQWLENQAMYARYITQESGRKNGAHDVQRAAKDVFEKVYKALLDDRNAIRKGFDKHHDQMSTEIKQSVVDYASDLAQQVRESSSTMDPEDVQDLDNILAKCRTQIQQAK